MWRVGADFVSSHQQAAGLRSAGDAQGFSIGRRNYSRLKLLGNNIYYSSSERIRSTDPHRVFHAGLAAVVFHAMPSAYVRKRPGKHPVVLGANGAGVAQAAC